MKVEKKSDWALWVVVGQLWVVKLDEKSALKVLKWVDLWAA
jgi:hypothetical protein